MLHAGMMMQGLKNMDSRQAIGSRRGSTLGTFSLSTEHMNGRTYEFVDDEDEEAPMPPRQSPDVRALDLNSVHRLHGPLKFVEAEFFQVMVCAVIVSNLILVAHIQFHPEDEEGFWFIEQLILVFYIAEIVLRMAHFQGRFFCWVFYDNISNYVDMMVVSYGILDQWVLSGEGKARVVMALRGFRLVRLVRVCRVVHTLLRGDFHWVDSPTFQWFVGGIIALNALFMGLETEYVHNACWWWVNQVFLCFFLFEIAVRLRRAGVSRFFYRGEELTWNYLDSIIVVTGVLDQWFVPLVSTMLQGDREGLTGGLGQMIMLVRILRLMRLLRLLRLVKAVRPLYHLAVGIMKALQSMFWVLVLTMVALYASALLTTNLIGKAMIPEAQDLAPETRALFGTVFDSLFTLFGIMNRQYWQDIAPIFDEMPWAKPVWVIFTILSSWALLSVMTGVVSDNMLEVRQAQEQKDSDAFEEFRERLLRVLTEVFTAADRDGSGSLEKEEYTEILTSPFHVRRLQRLANVPIQDLIGMFDWLDVDKGGSISFEDFVHGFDWLNEAVTGKSLLKLESAVRQRCCNLEKSIHSVRRQLRHVNDESDSQLRHAQASISLAKQRFEEQLAQVLADTEVLEKEAKGTRTEASRCRTALLAAESVAERAAEQQRLAWERQQAEAIAAAAKAQPQPPPPAEAKTLGAIASRLMGAMSPTRRKKQSPQMKAAR